MNMLFVMQRHFKIRRAKTSLAFSGHTVQLIDLKKRDKTDFTKLINEAHRDIDNTLSMFEKFKILTQSEKEKIHTKRKEKSCKKVKIF